MGQLGGARVSFCRQKACNSYISYANCRNTNFLNPNRAVTGHNLAVQFFAQVGDRSVSRATAVLFGFVVLSGPHRFLLYVFLRSP